MLVLLDLGAADLAIKQEVLVLFSQPGQRLVAFRKGLRELDICSHSLDCAQVAAVL